jgi:Flp pilus assembly protein TadB
MMMIVGLLARLGLSERVAGKVAPWVLGAGIVIAALLAFQLWDYFDDRAAINADRAAANAKAAERERKADARADAERSTNADTNRDQEQAYDDAIHRPAAGDHVDPAVRLACERLRRAGQDTAAIPECGGR